MINLVRKNILVVLCAVFIAHAAHSDEKSFNNQFWTGHQLRSSLGYITSKVEAYRGYKIRLIGNAAFFYGYEYGWQFADHWFTSLGLEWIIAYPRNFPTRPITPLRRALTWIQPLTHVRIGYVFNNYSVLTLGLTYLWALSLDFRIPLGEHLYFETQYLQWLDGLLELNAISPTFGAAYDLANFSIGMGWKF
ncbi:MAG TPA: hypothetical protein VEL47_03305 [Myxococcota bacterium]|nr:hypothetical protein [Myxococcota bacterium]